MGVGNRMGDSAVSENQMAARPDRWTLVSEREPLSSVGGGIPIEYWDRSIDPSGCRGVTLRYDFSDRCWRDEARNVVDLQSHGTWREFWSAAEPEQTSEPVDEEGDGWITAYAPSADDTCEAANYCVEVTYGNGRMGCYRRAVLAADWKHSRNAKHGRNAWNVIAWRRIRPAYQAVEAMP